MTRDDLIRAEREKRLALLVQRETLTTQQQQVALALRENERAVFACDGAIEALMTLLAENKADG